MLAALDFSLLTVHLVGVVQTCWNKCFISQSWGLVVRVSWVSASSVGFPLVKWADVFIWFCCVLCEGLMGFTGTIHKHLVWYNSSRVSACEVYWVSLGWIICFETCFLRLMFLPFHLRSVGWSCTILNITLILQSYVSDPLGKHRDCFKYPYSEWRHKNISLFHYYEVSHVFRCYRYSLFVLVSVLEVQSLAGHAIDLMQSLLGTDVGVSFTKQFFLRFSLSTCAPWGSFWVTFILKLYFSTE